ncbi:HNH endonuclease signature motif containing protein [Brevibacillus brevis]|uniref:HNH endonuclease signature motif containing protein n=1 Tax=Brevibacillus brevis TaxID=1393 RepID=UPI0007D8A28D|nr:HNH endonuclease signature motif containing protein [Brevibacillus brevis]WGV59547.1 HNH endonuclease signature motif containing protein [Brevibacillus brevis]
MFFYKSKNSLLLILLLLLVTVIPTFASAENNTNATSATSNDLHIEMTDDITLEDLAKYLEDPRVLESNDVTVIQDKQISNSSEEIMDGDVNAKPGIIVAKFKLPKEEKNQSNAELGEEDKEKAQLADGGAVFFLELDNDVLYRQVKTRVKLVSFVIPTGGKKPDWWNADLALSAATERNGSYIVEKREDIKWDNPTVGSYTNWVTYYLKDARFWQSVARMTPYFGKVPAGGSLTVFAPNKILLNSKAIGYPYYKDPISQQIMPEPETTTWTKVHSDYRVPWTKKEREEYKDWYRKQYKTNFDFDGYEIHHIRPRAYGGSNDPINLIPVPRDFHRKTVSPWFTGYGAGDNPCADEETE